MKKLVSTILILALVLIVVQNAKAGAENKITTSISCNLQFVTVEGEIKDNVGYVYIQHQDGSLEQVYFYQFNATGNFYTWFRDDLVKYGDKIEINSGYFGGTILEKTTFYLNCGNPEFSATRFVFLPIIK